MSYPLLVLSIALAFVVAMMAALLFGRRVGQRRLADDPKAAVDGLGVIDTAVFAIFGLLIAFTFSGAGARFDERRMLIVQEANSVGTAWLRLDLLPAEAQPALRDLFRAYLDARIATTALMPDEAAATQAAERATALQSRIWSAAVASTGMPGLSPAVPSLLLPAVNEMFDITVTRRMAAERHPPLAIWVLFCLLAVVSAFLAGQGTARSKRASLPHLLGFPAVLSAVVLLDISLEHPRLGLITLTDFDQTLVDVRAAMDAAQTPG
jgi:hypothetical protein